jgi:hypothetical protein
MATHDSRGYCYRCKIMHDEWICPYEVQDCQFCGEDGHSANECQRKYTVDMGRRAAKGLKDETSRVSGPHHSSVGSNHTPMTSDGSPRLRDFDLNFLAEVNHSPSYHPASHTPSFNDLNERGGSFHSPIIISDSSSLDNAVWESGPASLIYPRDSLESAEVPPKPKLVVPAPRSCGNRWTFWSSSSSKKTRS